MGEGSRGGVIYRWPTACRFADGLWAGLKLWSLLDYLTAKHGQALIFSLSPSYSLCATIHLFSPLSLSVSNPLFLPFKPAFVSSPLLCHPSFPPLSRIPLPLPHIYQSSSHPSFLSIPLFFSRKDSSLLNSIFLVTILSSSAHSFLMCLSVWLHLHHFCI